MLIQVHEGPVQEVQDRPEEGHDLHGLQVLPPGQAPVQEVVQVHGLQEDKFVFKGKHEKPIDIIGKEKKLIKAIEGKRTIHK